MSKELKDKMRDILLLKIAEGVQELLMTADRQWPHGTHLRTLAREIGTAAKIFREGR
jgi:hypothetical protein